MSTTKQPKPPAGLNTAGTAFWKSIHGEFVLREEPHKLAMLEQACKVLDVIAELEDQMQGQPMTVPGPGRQIIIHPLVDNARHQRGLFVSIIRALGLPEAVADDEAAAEAQKAAEARSQRARHAAQVRHHGKKTK
uniref:Terminase n=1 Tax=Mycolicibacterium phage Alyssa1 TaxID=3240801 RepID=A0AB39U242_9CAUD